MALPITPEAQADVYRVMADEIARQMGKPRFCQPKRTRRRRRRERGKRLEALRGLMHRRAPWDHQGDALMYLLGSNNRDAQKILRHAENYGYRGAFHNMEMIPGVTIPGTLVAPSMFRDYHASEFFTTWPQPDATLRDRVFGADYAGIEERVIVHMGDLVHGEAYFEEAAPFDPEQLTKLSKQMNTYLHKALIGGSSTLASPTNGDDGDSTKP